MIHDNRITLNMCMATVLSDSPRMEDLSGFAFCDRTGYDLRRAAFSEQFHHHI